MIINYLQLDMKINTLISTSDFLRRFQQSIILNYVNVAILTKIAALSDTAT
jgi:hypothetical protein